MSTEKILLVTTWNIPCGIAEHSAQLKDAIETQSDLRLEPFSDLHPHPVINRYQVGPRPSLVHLNYHAALHSQWTPEYIKLIQKEFNAKVLVTYHDTGIPNTDQCKYICAAADAVVIHEDASADLTCKGPIHYWRMGVADAPRGHYEFGPQHYSDPVGAVGACFTHYAAQPVLGSIGFPFGWKNYDRLAQITRDQGWALLLIAPNATQDQVATWRMTNPYSWIRTEFVPRGEAQSLLAGCDATAFAYVCNNAGQSAAILQGVAARKPVIALKTCRQFRSLYEDPIGRATIRWAETFDDVAAHLRNVRIQRIDPGMVALAEQESWRSVGLKYINLYQSLLHR